MDNGTSVGSLHYDLGVDDSGLQSGLNTADKSVQSFGDKAQTVFKASAAVLAGLSVGLIAFAKNATSFTEDYVKSSKTLGIQLGVTTTEASRLVAAFGRMGIEATSASQMFGIFEKNIQQSTNASKDNQLAVQKLQIQIEQTKKSISDTTDEIKKNGDSTGVLNLKLRDLNNTLDTQKNALTKSADSFQRLGISTVDAQGKQKDFNTLLDEVADKFQKMPNGVEKTTIALDLFGRSGKDMIKVLNLGSQGISDLEAQADKLGLTLNPQTITAVNGLIQSQKNLKEQTDALKIAVGTATAPALTQFNKAINDVVGNLIKTDGPLKTVTVNFLAFGGPVFAGASAILAFTANLEQSIPILAAALNPVTLLIASTIASAAAYYLLFTHLQEVRDFFSTDWGVAIQIATAVMAPFLAIPLEIILHWNAVKDFLIDVFNWVVNNWPYLLSALAGPFSLAVALVLGHIQQIKDGIVGFAMAAGSWLYDAGRNIVQGMINGISDMFGALTSKLKDAVGNAIKSVKNFLGIHSPSKVFMDIGKNVTAGFVKGITDSSGQAMAAMGTLANNVISPSLSLGGSAVAAGAATTNHFGGTSVQIGQINNAQDESYVLRRLDRNQALEGMGISPVQ